MFGWQEDYQVIESDSEEQEVEPRVDVESDNARVVDDEINEQTQEEAKSDHVEVEQCQEQAEHVETKNEDVAAHDNEEEKLKQSQDEAEHLETEHEDVVAQNNEEEKLKQARKRKGKARVCDEEEIDNPPILKKSDLPKWLKDMVIDNDGERVLRKDRVQDYEYIDDQPPDPSKKLQDH